MSYFLTSIVISPFSILGNSLVCIIVFSNPSMRSSTNHLLVNLAVADMSYSLLQAIGMMTLKFAGSTFDWAMFCRSSSFTIHVICGVSIGTLLIIAIERYFAIVKPFNFQRRRSATSWLMALWIGVVIFMLPPVFFSWDYKKTTDNCEVLSYYKPPHRLYYFFLVILFLFLPSIVIVYCYSRIVYTLWYSPAKVTNSASIHSRRKLARMLIVVSSIFVSSWLTVCVAQILLLFDVSVPEALDVIIHLFVNLNTAINPVVYSLHSADFRRHLKGIPRLCLCKHKTSSPVATFDVLPASARPRRKTSHRLLENFQGDTKL